MSKEFKKKSKNEKNLDQFPWLNKKYNLCEWNKI